MDRLSKLRDLVEHALDELAHPTALTHEQYLVVAALHEISLELAALRVERLRLMASIEAAEGPPALERTEL